MRSQAELRALGTFGELDSNPNIPKNRRSSQNPVQPQSEIFGENKSETLFQMIHPSFKAPPSPLQTPKQTPVSQPMALPVKRISDRDMLSDCDLGAEIDERTKRSTAYQGFLNVKSFEKVRDYTFRKKPLLSNLKKREIEDFEKYVLQKKRLEQINNDLEKLKIMNKRMVKKRMTTIMGGKSKRLVDLHTHNSKSVKQIPGGLEGHGGQDGSPGSRRRSSFLSVRSSRDSRASRDSGVRASVKRPSLFLKSTKRAKGGEKRGLKATGTPNFKKGTAFSYNLNEMMRLDLDKSGGDLSGLIEGNGVPPGPSEVGGGGGGEENLEEGKKGEEKKTASNQNSEESEHIDKPLVTQNGEKKPKKGILKTSQTPGIKISNPAFNSSSDTRKVNPKIEEAPEDVAETDRNLVISQSMEEGDLEAQAKKAKKRVSIMPSAFKNDSFGHNALNEPGKRDKPPPSRFSKQLPIGEEFEGNSLQKSEIAKSNCPKSLKSSSRWSRGGSTHRYRKSMTSKSMVFKENVVSLAKKSKELFFYASFSDFFKLWIPTAARYRSKTDLFHRVIHHRFR